MTGRARWRPALAALLGAVAVAAAVVGGIQATGPVAAPEAVAPAPARGPLLPGSSDPDALVPPVGATVRPPEFAPSAVVPSPGPAAAPAAGAGPGARAAERGEGPRGPRPPSPGGSGFDPDDPTYQGVDDPGTAAGRAPTSGETQYEWGCRRGDITEGC